MTDKQASDLLSGGLAAAGTAVLPGVGTAVGASIGNVIGKLFGSGTPTAWKNAPAETRELFMKYPRAYDQAFLTWMQQKHPEAFSTAKQVQAMLPLFLKETRNAIIRPNETAGGGAYSAGAFVPGVTVEAYRAMGIDYDATNQANQVPNAPIQWVMLPGGGSPSVPSTAVANIADVLEKQKSGQPLTSEEKSLLSTLKSATDGGSTPWGVIAVVVLAVVLLAKR